MIVISGALVLVALVLLVIGLIGPSLGFVYASIGASLAAFAFLVVGILQRRKEEPVGIDGAPTPAADIAAASRAPETRPVATEELVGAPAGGGEVLVVEGRPRYHVAGCRYLSGKDPKSIEVGQARADGFTACGVCKPDEALAATASAPVADLTGVTVLEDAPAEAVTVPAAAVKAPARKAAAKAAAAPAKTPAKKAAKAPAKQAAPAKAAAAAKAPAKAAKAPAKKAAPAKAAAAKAPAKAAKAPAKKAAAAKATRR